MDEKDPIQQEQLNEISRKMSQWRQANPKATLTEIEEAVEAELAKLHKQLVEEMVQEAAADTPAVPGLCAVRSKDGQKWTAKAETKE